jgi:hypothetical protein
VLAEHWRLLQSFVRSTTPLDDIVELSAAKKVIQFSQLAKEA